MHVNICFLNDFYHLILYKMVNHEVNGGHPRSYLMSNAIYLYISYIENLKMPSHYSVW